MVERTLLMAALVTTTLALPGVAARAAEPAGTDPVALVEEVSGKTGGIGFLDYLPIGKVLKLGSADRQLVHLPAVSAASAIAPWQSPPVGTSRHSILAAADLQRVWGRRWRPK